MLLVTLGDFVYRCIEFWGTPTNMLVAGNQLFVGAAYSNGGFFLLILLPFIAAIPFSDVYFMEKKYSIIYMTITRFGSRRKYYLISAMFVFLSAFTITFIPLVINAVLTSITFPYDSLREFSNSWAGQAYLYNIENAGSRIPFSSLFIQSPYLYNYVIAFMISLFAGVVGVFAYVFSYFIKKRRIIVYMSFFVIYQCITFISSYTSRFFNINISLLSYLFFFDSSPNKNITVFCIASGLLFIIILCMAIRGMQKLKNVI